MSILNGAYVLQTVDRSDLPVDLSSSSTVHLVLLADTMRFDGRGTVEEASMTRMELSGSAPQLLRQTKSMGYDVRGRSVRFSYPCPINASCAGPPVGDLLTRNMVIVRWGTRTYLYL